MRKTIIIALGGNAISLPGQRQTIHDQFANTRRSIRRLAELLKSDRYNIVITHGNGPQVGDLLQRVEATSGELPFIPLGVLVAGTQATIGYMIEQSLQNFLMLENVNRQVVSLVTQVLVHKNDASLRNPTKFIGKVLTRDAAEPRKLAHEHGWIVREDRARGWRRVVGSPQPLKVINAEIIEELLQRGHIVIAGGGGGIPVYTEDDGTYEGVDAVIDKDRTSALLGIQIRAEELLILTEVDRVCLRFGQPDVRRLDHLTATEAEQYLAAGEFPPGSMGPKVEAAVKFVRNGGRRAVITSFAGITEFLAGSGGTVITP